MRRAAACALAAAARCGGDAGDAEKPAVEGDGPGASCDSGGLPDPIRFTDVTAEAGLPEDASPCGVFDDLDGDGRPDLVVNRVAVGAATAWGVAAYRNRGDGTFAAESVETPAGWEQTGPCGAGDIDADGDLDLVIGQYNPPRLAVLENRGGLRFSDVSERWLAGVALDPGGAADPGSADLTFDGLFDFDNDGRVDLYVTYFDRFQTRVSCLKNPPCTDEVELTCAFTGGHADFECHPSPPFEPSPPLLLRNTGARFAPVPAPPGLDRPRNCNAVGVWDWDDDGYLDVFYAIDFGDNSLYLNPGARGGAWQDALPDFSARADRYNHSMGVAFGDLDRDGLYDFWVTDAGPEHVYYGTGGGGPTPEDVEERAARIADPRDRERTIASFTSHKSGWSPVIADFNHDGWPDVLVASTGNCSHDGEFEALMEAGFGAGADCGEPQVDYAFTSDRCGGYLMEPMDNPGHVRASAGSAGFALADYDGDGDLDAAQAYMTPMRFRLLRNDSDRSDHHHHLIVRLRGRGPDAGGANTLGLGAKVELRRGGSVLYTGQVQGSTGSITTGWRALHFGLGDVDAIDEIRVRWPTNPPHPQVVPGPIALDRTLTIEETIAQE